MEKQGKSFEERLEINKLWQYKTTLVPKNLLGEIMSVSNRVLISGRQTGQTSKH